MKFQKERYFTALNADELKVGSKVIVADDLCELKANLSHLRLTKIIEKVEPESWAHRFSCDDGYRYALAYLIEEPEEKKLKWTDLRIGDVITDGECFAMVIQIDKYSEPGIHILAGYSWLSDRDLEKWEKVEE